MDLSETFSRSTAQLDFALARSDFLDSFADLEAAIWVVLDKSGTMLTAKEPFGNRVKSFRELQSGTQLAKCRVNQKNQIADALLRLLPIRADLVHSRMQISVWDGEPVAIFTNAALADDPDALKRIMKLARLKTLTEKLRHYSEVTRSLRKPINPASSPQPPSPDEAGDP